MPWARIDDGFDDHPKVLALLEHDDGATALGLWTLCFTWANRNTRKKGKVPGHLPASLPRRYLGVLGRDAAKLLVDVGLWDPDLDEGGWRIHDFAQHLPTAETSSARAEAGKRGAAARWGKQAETPASDSKLPSGDGKPDGSRIAGHMANDGKSTGTAEESPAAPGTGTADGSMPSGDGNLLSEDGKSDGQAMASDGSRARTQSHTHKKVKVKDSVPAPPPREDVERLCDHLASRVEAGGSKRPAITKAWRDAARLMIDLDGRTEQQVHDAIDWCQNDPFWHSRVMAMPKLREKYDQLRLQAIEERKKARPGGGLQPGAAGHPRQVSYSDEEYTRGWQ